MYTPLKLYSHGSLLQSSILTKKAVGKLSEEKITSCAITDIGNVSMAVNFYKDCIEKDIKPILGCTINLCSNYDSDIYNITLLCKNKVGWQNLLKIIQKCNDPTHCIIESRISISDLAACCISDIFCLLGGYNMAFDDFNILHGLFDKSLILVKSFPYPEYDKHIDNAATKYDSIVVGVPEPFYLNIEQADTQKILLCAKYKIKIDKLSGLPNNYFFLPTNNEMENRFSESELEQTNRIAAEIKEFSLLEKPSIPKFSDNEYEDLKNICLANKLYNADKHKDRLNSELVVIKKANLSGYFLIVSAFIEFARNNDILIGPGRGSVGGSLVSYLLDITQVDPLDYGLIFERFYNEGRNTADRVSLPDIDVDVPSSGRKRILDYLEEKYSKNNVAQFISFQTMKGGESLQRVLSSSTDIAPMEIFDITKRLPEEHKITAELKEMKDRLGYKSIIRWTLENQPDKFSDWCIIKNKRYEGPLSIEFKTAIELEGVNSALSKHPAGIIISNNPLINKCPIILDKDKNYIAGFDMNSLKDIGLCKFDILCITLLDKLDYTRKLMCGN